MRSAGREHKFPGTIVWAAAAVAVSAVSNHAYGFSAPFNTEGAFSVHPGQLGVRVLSTYQYREGDRSIVLPRFEGFYRINADLEIDVAAPFQFDSEPSQGTHYAYGSTALEVAYRLIAEDQKSWTPTVSVVPELELPSTAPRYNIGTGYVHSYLPLVVQKDIGKWTAYGNAAFGINPGQGNKNYWFFGAAVTRKVTDTLHLGGEIYYRSSSQDGLKDTTGFNVGGELEFSGGQSLYFSAGRAIQNVTNTNQISGYLGYQLSF